MKNNEFVHCSIFYPGIASFRDRYILTIDSKSTGSHQAESCRLLLFDPNNGQFVYEQNIAINRQADAALKQQYVSHIKGTILHESTSKPRFLAVHNDQIYIADLGERYAIFLLLLFII